MFGTQLERKSKNPMIDKANYILVTGASSGIGRCIAVGLSNRFNMILVGRREDHLLETKLLCCNPESQLVLKLDLSRIDELEQSLSTFMEKNGINVAHFIHCAGLMRMLPLKMITADNLISSFSTNVASAALVAKVLMQRRVNSSALKSAVFISSNISNFGAKAFSTYAASKAALDALMRCLAVELAPRVRVNSVLPGAIQTEMTAGIFSDKEMTDRLSLSYPLGLGQPEDIYEIVDFLISDRARWITGQQFVVDGGRTINVSG